MKVVFVNHSDVRGGASVVTLRLVQALRRAGVDARMVVGRIEGDRHPEYLSELRPRWRRSLAFWIEHAEIFVRNGFSRVNLFKESIATVGMPVSRHPWVKEADVVVLAWINQGLMSLRQVRKIDLMGKRIIWSMHDMWCLTGVCHHAAECQLYKTHCGHCPLITGGARAVDLSWHTFNRKLKLYAAVPGTFVAVSHWLGSRARESALLKDAHVEVIPNVFPIENFTTAPASASIPAGIDPSLPIVVMGAARIDDSIKGLPLAIEVLNKLHHSGVKAQAVFFGALKNPLALSGLLLPHVHLGPVADAEILQSLYARAEVVMSTSLYETLPGTVIEGMAAGAWAVTFDRGGQRDIIEPDVTGNIITFGNTGDMAAAIARVISTGHDRDLQHQSIDRLFGEERVVAKWIHLLQGC